MRRLVFVLAVTFCAAAAPAYAADQNGPAPADEYFGRYAMSPIGVGNVIRDASLRFDDSSNGPSMTSGPLAFVADAIRDWESKYPNDSWIPKDLFFLEQAYLRAHTQLGNDYARKTATWLVTDYPNSHFANDARLSFADAVGGDVRPLVSATGAPQQTLVTEAVRNGDAQNPAWARFSSLRAPLPTPR